MRLFQSFSVGLSMTRAALMQCQDVLPPQDTWGCSLPHDMEPWHWRLCGYRFHATGRRRHTFRFNHVELFQDLVRIRFLAHKYRPITLTIGIPRKFLREPIVILISSGSSPRNASISSSLLPTTIHNHQHKLQYRPNCLRVCNKIGKDQLCCSSIQLSPWN